MKMKKFLAVCLSALTVTGMLAGCGGAKGGDTSSAGAEKKGSSAEGSVYYLNFKPEIADQWEEVAAKYTEETGVPVKVKTAASNQYEQTLKSEMAKSDAPTLFQINGPVGYQSWKEYCADLKDTDFYNMLVDKEVMVYTAFRLQKKDTALSIIKKSWISILHFRAQKQHPWMISKTLIH